MWLFHVVPVLLLAGLSHAQTSTTAITTSIFIEPSLALAPGLSGRVYDADAYRGTTWIITDSYPRTYELTYRNSTLYTRTTVNPSSIEGTAAEVTTSSRCLIEPTTSASCVATYVIQYDVDFERVNYDYSHEGPLENAGEYWHPVVLTAGLDILQATSSATPDDEGNGDGQGRSSGGSSTPIAGPIAGGVVGFACVVGAVVVGFLVYRKRRARREAVEEIPAQPVTAEVVSK